MRIKYIVIVFCLALAINFNLLSKNLFESDFYNVEVITKDHNQTKLQSIEEVQKKSLQHLIEKILDKNEQNKFKKIIRKKNVYNNLINNIIIEDEIITNEKYIAKIKVNFNIKKFLNLLRNNKINYTDLESQPFLFISLYHLHFIQIGMDKKNLLNNLFKIESSTKESLINFNFPNLDHNDRYILSNKKIINKDKNAFNKILNKYNLNQLIYINLHKEESSSLIHVDINIFDSNDFYNIGRLLIDNNFQSTELFFQHVSNQLLFYLIEWWKGEYQIDNSKINLVNCNIITSSFEELIEIKSILNNISQIKHIKTKKIELNNNVIEFIYYGDFNILLKNFSLSNIFYDNLNGCNITLK